MMSNAQIEALVRDSVAALQRGDAAAARGGLETVTATGRANAQVWMILATALRQLGDRGASSFYKSAVRFADAAGAQLPADLKAEIERARRPSCFRCCGFRVGNETREWEEGKLLVFDDSIEHEARNDSDRDRVIQIFDVWRPELTGADHRAITAMFEAIDDYPGGRLAASVGARG